MNARKPCLCTVKLWANNDHELIIYITYDYFRYYSSAYSGNFYWPCGFRSTFLIIAISPCDWDQTENKICQQTFFRKKVSMLTGLKVSSLAQKCVFFRPEPTGKWGPH